MQRESIGRIGLTDVHVEPVNSKVTEKGNQDFEQRRPATIHLRVVDVCGERFTERDLEFMALTHETLIELLNLSDRRKEGLCAKYLPGYTLPKTERVQCWIGPDDIVDVEFHLSAFPMADQPQPLKGT